MSAYPLRQKEAYAQVTANCSSPGARLYLEADERLCHGVAHGVALHLVLRLPL